MRVKFILSIAFLSVGILYLNTVATKAQGMPEIIKLYNSERYDDAENLCQNLINEGKASGEIYFRAGKIIMYQYFSDPFSNTVEEVTKSCNNLFSEGIRKDSMEMLNYVGIGMMYLFQNGDTTNADKYFNKALSKIPRKAKLITTKDIEILKQIALAESYSKNPRFEKAFATLEKAIAYSPKDAALFLAMGEVCMKHNDASGAITNYKKASFLDPSLPLPYVAIGNIYVKARNLNEARPNFEKALSLDSLFAPAYKGLGEMYSMGGLPKLSKANYKKFLDISGNNTPALISYSISLFRAKDYTETANAIESVLKVDSSKVFLYRLAGYSCYEMRPPDYQKSYNYLTTFFRKTAKDKIITSDYAYLGKTMIKLKKDSTMIDDGLRNLVKAYLLDTTDVELISECAYDAYYLKHYRLAIEMFTNKCKAGKCSNSDLMFAGKAYYQLKEFSDADSVFNLITTSDPQNIQAYLWMANSTAGLDPDSKLGLAKPKYETVIEKASGDTIKYVSEIFESLNYLSSYYYTQEKPDLDKAIQYYGRMAVIDPGNKSRKKIGYQGLGLAYLKKKDYPTAKLYLTKVMEMDPSNAEIKKTIDGINKVLNAQKQQ